MSHTELSKELPKEAGDSDSAHGEQAPHDRAVEFLNEKRASSVRELMASLREGEPIGPKEAKLAAQILALDKKIDQLNKDKAQLPNPQIAPKRPSKPDSASDAGTASGPIDQSSVPDLSPMEQILMAGALEMESVDEAVLKIYDNMHKRTGWKYQATSTDQVGVQFTKGGKTVGMCQSFREAFIAALECYRVLRQSHPLDAVRNGPLEVKQNNNLVGKKFCTRQGLKLMGDSGLEGNVYLEIDGKGKATASGLNSIKKFVFTGHWTASVNGVEYDPIFYSINEDNVATVLDYRFGQGSGRYIVDKEKASLFPENEFGVGYIWISDWDQFADTVKRMSQLYSKNRQEIDDIVAGKKSTKEGTFSKTDRKCYTDAKQLVKDRVADPITFEQVARAAIKDTFTRAESKEYGPALDKIMALARM